MAEYQVMPELTAEEYAELKADIEQRGVMVPIEYDEFGNVLDGYHRLKICGELGIKDFPRVIRAGMTEAEKLTHARKLNMARRHLTQEQKSVLIREQIKATPEQSDRQIAQALGVSPTTVGTARRDMEDKGQLSKLDTSTGTDGKTYPRKPVSVFNPTVSAQRTEAVQRISAASSKAPLADGQGGDSVEIAFCDIAREIFVIPLRADHRAVIAAKGSFRHIQVVFALA